MPGQNVLVNGSSSVYGYAGTQNYIISPNYVPANKSITIADTQGNDTIDLLNGLEIAGSLVATDSLRLVLKNGTTLDILSASGFEYRVGTNNEWSPSPFKFNFETLVKIFLDIPEGVPTTNGIIHTGGPVTMSLTPPSHQSMSNVEAELVLAEQADDISLLLESDQPSPSAYSENAVVETTDDIQLSGVNNMDPALDIVIA